MRHSTLLRSILIFGIVWAGCGRASEPASGEQADSYFPLIPGARWVYELRTDLGNLRVEVVARGDMQVPGRDLAVFVVDETNRGPSMGFVETAPVAYMIDGPYRARLAAVDYNEEGGLRLLGKEDAPTWFLPVNPKPGDQWVQENKLFTSPEGGGKRMGWAGEVLRTTQVTVPAGTFDDALEVRSEYWDPQNASEGPTAVYHDYYVRGIGLVRSVTEDPSGDPTHNIEQALLEYRLP